VSDAERLGQTLAWLCAIPSFTGEESALCDAVAERLAAARLHAPPRRHGNSLVVPVTRGSSGPRIALCGHLDVVRVDHDGPVRIESDRLYGPGASDMKAGLALMLDLVEHDAAICAGVDLSLVFYAREEGSFADNELALVLDRDPELCAVDLAVCLEPSDNRLSLGACGSLHAEVTFHGRSAHSARPWLGDNAIHRAGALLCELAALAPRESMVEGLCYRTVTSATWAEGGRARNVVPDRFVLNLNHRFAPSESLEDARRAVAQLVAQRGDIHWRDECPPAPPRADHPLVVALAAAGVEGVEPKQGWTDVARFAQRGVAAVNFGPGLGEQAHQRNEWASLTKLERGRRILADWLQALRARG
jgi:succinyl-diaminopimelate desuccinylase